MQQTLLTPKYKIKTIFYKKDRPVSITTCMFKPVTIYVFNWFDCRGTKRGFFYETFTPTKELEETAIKTGLDYIDNIQAGLSRIEAQKARIKPRKRKGLNPKQN